MSGAAVQLLASHRDVSEQQLGMLVESVSVFARTSPGEKERIITAFKSRGRIALMCGDGTNDVGALKQAHVGVALLSTATPTAAEAEKTKRSVAPPSRATTSQERLHEAMRKLEEEEAAATVRLGDASIAAPCVSLFLVFLI